MNDFKLPNAKELSLEELEDKLADNELDVKTFELKLEGLESEDNPDPTAMDLLRRQIGFHSQWVNIFKSLIEIKKMSI